MGGNSLQRILDGERKAKKIVSFDADACNQEQVVTYDERSNVLTIHQKHGETYLQIVYFSLLSSRIRVL